MSAMILSGTDARLRGWPRFVSLKALITAVVIPTGVGIFLGLLSCGQGGEAESPSGPKIGATQHRGSPNHDPGNGP